MGKTASKRWRESGSTLSFKEWIERENKKKESVNFVSFDSEIPKIANQEIQDTIYAPVDYGSMYDPKINIKKTEDKSKVFGLSRTTLILSSLVLVGSLTYFFIQRAKRNK